MSNYFVCWFSSIKLDSFIVLFSAQIWPRKASESSTKRPSLFNLHKDGPGLDGLGRQMKPH